MRRTRPHARARLDPGYVCSWRVSAGANPDEITHLHHYPDYDARDAAIAEMDADPAWNAFDAAAAPAVASRSSEIYLPAAACFAAAGVERAPADAVRLATGITPIPGSPARSNPGASRGVFEVRTYQLELGYNPIPKLVAHMAEGLPSKLASDPNRVGRLVGMFYSDVGGSTDSSKSGGTPVSGSHSRARGGANGGKVERDHRCHRAHGADVRHETVRPDGELLASERETGRRSTDGDVSTRFQSESARAIRRIVTSTVPSTFHRCFAKRRDAPTFSVTTFLPDETSD